MKKTIKDYHKAIELNPKDAVAYYNRGNAYAEQGVYDKAIRDYNEALKLNPDFVGAYNNRGLAMLKAVNGVKEDKEDVEYAEPRFKRFGAYTKDEYTDAIKEYTKAIELDPEDTEAYYMRGYAYDIQGMYEEALEDYDRAIELNPNHSHAYFNRSSVYVYLGMYYKAIEDYDRAIELNPRLAKL